VNFVKNEEILYCKSAGRYTEFYLTDKRKLVASKSLGEYEEQFDSKSFFRIHRSFIVNLNYITNINKKAGNYCELTNGQSLPISRRRMENLIQFLRQM
jgi:two-component system LytT family response regulator